MSVGLLLLPADALGLTEIYVLIQWKILTFSERASHMTYMYMGLTVVNILNETKLDFNPCVYLSKNLRKLANESCTQTINNKKHYLSR